MTYLVGQHTAHRSKLHVGERSKHAIGRASPMRDGPPELSPHAQRNVVEPLHAEHDRSVGKEPRHFAAVMHRVQRWHAFVAAEPPDTRVRAPGTSGKWGAQEGFISDARHAIVSRYLIGATTIRVHEE